jgi:cytochrome c-type biogenesis protein CcmH
MRRLLAALLALGCLAAADPAERLPDRDQEGRARALFQEIRCVVCQNETIDASEAELARDLRGVVREQVAAGRSDAEIKQFLVQRYGEFVLFRPRFGWSTAVLWLAPFAVVLAGVTMMLRRGRRQVSAPALSEEEERRLAALTGDDGKVT